MEILEVQLDKTKEGLLTPRYPANMQPLLPCLRFTIAAVDPHTSAISPYLNPLFSGSQQAYFSCDGTL